MDPSPRQTINSYSESCYPFPHSIFSHSQQKNVKIQNPLVFMSTISQATSSTSNIQSIIDNALADYAKITGIDLSDTAFAATIEQSNSPEAILELLQGREKDFKEYRDGDRRLIGCLGPAVKVLQAFSGLIGDVASLVSHTTNQSSLLT